MTQGAKPPRMTQIKASKPNLNKKVSPVFWQSDVVHPEELTGRQRRFAELMSTGQYTQTQAALEAGYPESTAPTIASRLMNPTFSPKVVKYVRQLKNETFAKYDVTLESHLTKLGEIRDKAVDAGEFAVAVSAEKARGQVAGLYVDRKEIMVTRIDQMSKEEVLAEIARMQTEYPELARLTAPTIDMTAVEASLEEVESDEDEA